MTAQPDKSQKAGRTRIETQIHRRKKAKALSPLELEWDRINQKTPIHLRMPSTLMTPQPLKSKEKS
jgi:hypothetical protein